MSHTDDTAVYAGAVQVWDGEVYVRGSTDFLANTAGEKGGKQGLDILGVQFWRLSYEGLDVRRKKYHSMECNAFMLLLCLRPFDLHIQQ